MSNLFKVSLFTLGVILSSGAMAATGTGEAQAELTNPLSITSPRDVDFGTISIDPSAGAQTISIPFLICPATYVCSGLTVMGLIRVTGAPSTPINIDLTGSSATLDDGSGNQLIFDPVFNNLSDQYNGLPLDEAGIANYAIGGSIDFDGTEIAGTYTSQNGSPYTVTVNY